MNPNKGVREIHVIPTMQFAIMDIMAINIHQVDVKVMVSLRDK
jgi:hypothetical protein